MICIKTFRNPYGKEEAADILLGCDAKINIVKMEEIYYPYKSLKYSLTLPGKLAKLDKEVNCIIDLIYGRPAVGQGTAGFEEKEVFDNAIMQKTVSDEELYRIGYDFVFKLFLNRSKILSAPKIEVIKEELFYKLFYITQCRDEEDKDYFVLVDSIDGNITILDWKGEEEEQLSEQK